MSESAALVSLVQVFFGFGVVNYIAAAFFCGYVAYTKNRFPFGWILLGLAFPIISLIAIAGAGERPLQSWQKKDVNDAKRTPRDFADVQFTAIDYAVDR